MEVNEKNIIRFDNLAWVYGRVVTVYGEKQILSPYETIKIGDVYIMEFGYDDYELMNPCSDAIEAVRCNDNKTSVGRSCHKVIVSSGELLKAVNYDALPDNKSVLVECLEEKSGYVIDIVNLNIHLKKDSDG